MYGYSTRINKIKRFFFLLFLVILVSFLSIFLYRIYLNIDIKKYEINEIPTTAIRLSEEEEIPSQTNMLDEVVKSVVGISKIQDIGASIFLKDSTNTLGLGTGTIISENGYILTNWHVAGDKYATCYISLYNGKEYTGNVVWADENLDLAVIKIRASGLEYINLEDSDNIKLGEEVYAIGNPIGIEFQRTITAGIISGLNRTVKLEEEENLVYMEDLIQTDASINSGNSGGPLINKDGKMIGINSVKIDSAEGIGFAIPINIVKPILEAFNENSNFEEAYLGIFAYDKQVIPYLNSKVNFDSGVYVAEISIDGPCYDSGLKEGDIITTIDGFEINKMSELRNYIYTKHVGEEVRLGVLRSGKEYNLKIKLGKK